MCEAVALLVVIVVVAVDDGCDVVVFGVVRSMRLCSLTCRGVDCCCVAGVMCWL